MKKLLMAMVMSGAIFSMSSAVAKAQAASEPQWITFKGFQAQQAYEALTGVEEKHFSGKIVTKNAANIDCSRAENPQLIDAYECAINLQVGPKDAKILDK